MKFELRKPLWWSAASAGAIGYLTLWPVELRVPCLFKLCTGLDCPGCGITRALSALVRGDVVSAFNFNQLIFAIPVFLAIHELSKRTRFQRQITIGLVISATLGALGYFLVRNSFI